MPQQLRYRVEVGPAFKRKHREGMPGGVPADALFKAGGLPPGFQIPAQVRGASRKPLEYRRRLIVEGTVVDDAPRRFVQGYVDDAARLALPLLYLQGRSLNIAPSGPKAPLPRR